MWLLGLEDMKGGLGPVLAYGDAAGILSQKLVYAGFCASVMWLVGWHTCRLGDVARACGDARQNVIFHSFLGTCPMLT